MSADVKELVFGDRYTDRYSRIEGAATEVNAYLNGCFLVGLELGADERGDPRKPEYSFDTYLDDAGGQPTCRPAHLAERAKALLGREYRDTMSGLVGRATSVRFLLNGTEQLGLQPQTNDPTKMPDSFSIDSGQCEEIAAPAPVAAAPRTGGPPVRSVRP